MDRKFYGFPEIEQFRSVIHAVQYRTRFTGKDENGDPIFDETRELPTLAFRGTVKLHGTNAGIIFQYDSLMAQYTPHAQSRENIITPMKDNAGFAAFVHTSDVYRLLGLLPTISVELGEEMPDIKIYGEWCGGSIQKGVALNKLGKMFVIFAIKIGERWLTDSELAKVKIPEAKIYNILDYAVMYTQINFNDPKPSAEIMGEMVGMVEKECPVGKAFGVSGVGEGIVWMCVTPGWEGSRYWFKTKGDEHKVTKTKEKVPIDIEKVNNIKALVEIVVTEARLSQGLDYIKYQQNLTLEKKNVPVFLKWIYNDIIKEELDTIMKNGFEPKDVSGPISNKARDWFFKQIDKEVGL